MNPDTPTRATVTSALSQALRSLCEGRANDFGQDSADLARLIIARDAKHTVSDKGPDPRWALAHAGSKLLSRACKENQIHAFASLKKAGFDLNARLGQGADSAMALAAKLNHLEALSALHALGAVIHPPPANTSHHRSPYASACALLTAARSFACKPETLEFLLSLGADPNFSEYAQLDGSFTSTGEKGAHIHSCTPLEAAVLGNNPEFALAKAKALLRAGAKPDRFAPETMSPLALAAERGFTAMVELLLDHGANPDLPCAQDDTSYLDTPRAGGKLAAAYAAHNNHLAACSLLVEATRTRTQTFFMRMIEDEIHSRHGYGGPPRNRWPEPDPKLILSAARSCVSSRFFSCALTLAEALRDPAPVFGAPKFLEEVLLAGPGAQTLALFKKRGANFEQALGGGAPLALRLASLFGPRELALFASWGVDFKNARFSKGQNVWHCAAHAGNGHALSYFQRIAPNLFDAPDEQGNRPLALLAKTHSIASDERLKIAKKLCSLGADPLARNVEGKTALDLAVDPNLRGFLRSLTEAQSLRSSIHQRQGAAQSPKTRL